MGDTSEACDQKGSGRPVSREETLGGDVGAGQNSCRARVDLAENLLFRGEWNSAI
jgi:hypothetical protein